MEKEDPEDRVVAVLMVQELLYHDKIMEDVEILLQDLCHKEILVVTELLLINSVAVAVVEQAL
jgi:hypothetical protein|tara:strand:- start:482 stop:670 length:189 start_codon:yes stop_codon:yes gene_type:complete